MRTPQERRVFILAPVGQDAAAIAEILRQGEIASETGLEPAECLEKLARGAAALVLTEEALELPVAAPLLDFLRAQPAWSELPVIILTSGGEPRRVQLLNLAASAAGTVTLLERPMGPATLLRSVQVALRSRQRQYQVRDLFADQDRIQNTLRESQERVKLAMNVARLFAFEWDPVTDIVQRHGDAAAVLGVDFSRETGAAYFSRVHPDDRHRFAQLVTSLNLSHNAYKTEYRVLRPDGSQAVLEESGQAYFDAAGRFIRLIGMTTDITDRKKAEAALRKDLDALSRMRELSLRRFEPGLLENQLQQIIDAAVHIVAADKGNLQLLENDSLRIVAHHGHETPFLEFFAAAETQASVCGETLRARERVVVPDIQTNPFLAGTPSLDVLRAAGVRAVQSTPLLTRRGELLGILSTHWRRPYAPDEDDLKRIDLLARQAADLIEQARAEAGLRESEERFRILADGTTVLIWVHDVDARVRFVNRAWTAFFGKTLDQAEREGWQSLVHPEDVASYAAAFARAHAERLEFRAQARVRRYDGQWRWIESFATPRFSGSGEFLGMAGSSVDITERKAAEAVLARDKEELERLVSERTAKLQELVGELEHFSYSITHDMRAPLRAMMAFTQVLEELWTDSPDEEQKGYLRRIGVAARRMDLLIADALSYSKAVRSELPLAPVDVGQLLRGMLDTYPELQTAREGIVLDRDFPLVMGNEAGLTQCFSNLLENAVKFTKPGEAPQIRVWSELLPPQPSTPNPQPPSVRLWIEDHGIGISKTMLPRIFHMFARGASEKAGTGIGLALVRKVVERMDGRVGVLSEEGQGTRFWIELRSGELRPSAPGAAPASPSPA